jgi:hypothetical protein
LANNVTIVQVCQSPFWWIDACFVTQLNAYASTIEEVNEADAQGFEENKKAAQKGGQNAGVARRSFEQASGRPVISDQSYFESRKKLGSGEEKA